MCTILNDVLVIQVSTTVSLVFKFPDNLLISTEVNSGTTKTGSVVSIKPVGATGKIGPTLMKTADFFVFKSEMGYPLLDLRLCLFAPIIQVLKLIISNYRV